MELEHGAEQAAIDSCVIESSHLVCECGVDINLIEPPGDHRQQQHHRGQQTREPEGGVRHRHRQRAHRANLEGPVVEEGEAEVEDEGAPDGDVVEDGPVGGVQGDLGGHHDDEDGGHHRGEEVVVGQHQAQLVRLVVIRS